MSLRYWLKFLFWGSVVLASTISCYSQTAVWRMSKQLANENILTLTISESGTIFAGTKKTMFISDDGGETWAAVSFPDSSASCLASVPGGILFAGSSTTGVYGSPDTGKSWIKLKLPYDQVISMLVTGQGEIFAGTFGHGVVRSTDAGKSWEQTVLAKGSVWSMTESPGRQIFAGTEYGIFRSDENGRSWTTVNTGIVKPSVRYLFASPDSTMFVATNAAELYRSGDNGNRWVKIGAGISNAYIRAMVEASDHSMIAATAAGGVFHSTDRGATWSVVDMTGTHITAIAIDKKDFLWCGTHDRGVFRTLQPVTLLK